MKKIILLLVILNLFIQCTQNDVAISDQYIYNGRGGIKCEVNGILLKPTPGFLYTHSSLSYHIDNGVPFLNLSFVNSSMSGQIIRMKIINVNPNTNLTGNTYELKSQLNSESFGHYYGNDADFYTNQNFTGEFKILYHDVGKRILGGTFWYDAENSTGVICQIRNGQFDMTMN